MTENEFNSVLEKHGMSLVRPVRACGQGWGQVNMPDGSVRDRWKGGGSLADQASYLVAEAKAIGAAKKSAAAEATGQSDKEVKPAVAKCPDKAPLDFSGEGLRKAVGKALQKPKPTQPAVKPKVVARSVTKAPAKVAPKPVAKKVIPKATKKGASK